MVGIIASTMTIGLAGAALAAPPAKTLSSFEPAATDGVIVGGVRTITVTNVLNAPIEAHTVDLGQAHATAMCQGSLLGREKSPTVCGLSELWLQAKRQR